MGADFHRYLIIGGVPRAGTTSLFRWLSKHPEVCASSLKETRFFIDTDYPLPSPQRFNGTNLDQYDRFFSVLESPAHSIRVEATPDYLYSSTALRIAQFLPMSRMIFILRNPVERLISWFRYAKQRGFLARATSFEQYVRLQCDNPVDRETPIHLRALDQSRYWKYLPRFEKAFGDRLMIIDFAELKENPVSVMTRICIFAGIDEHSINAQDLMPENASYDSRFPGFEGFYGRIRRHVSYALHHMPIAVKLLRMPNRLVKSVLTTTRSKSGDVHIDDSLERLIYQAIGREPHTSPDCEQIIEGAVDDKFRKSGMQSDG